MPNPNEMERRDQELRELVSNPEVRVEPKKPFYPFAEWHRVNEALEPRR